MSKVLFTAEEDEKLVEWVGKYPCLYDLQLSTYKDQRIKDSAWKEIAGLVKKTEADCRKRWKNIKDTYQKRKKKGTGTGSSAGKPKWFLADMLSFLENTEYKRQSKSNIVEQDCASTLADDTDDSDMEPSEKSIVSCEFDSAAASSSNRESNSDAASSSNRESSSAPASTPNYRLEEKPTNKRKKYQMSEMLEERQKERNKVLQMISNGENDDVSLFFKSIAASVKKLPSELINEAKMKTLQLVIELQSRAKSTTTVPFISPGSDSASSNFSLVYSPPPQVIPAVSNNSSGPYNDDVSYTSGNNTNFLFTSNVLTGFNHT